MAVGLAHAQELRQHWIITVTVEAEGGGTEAVVLTGGLSGPAGSARAFTASSTVTVTPVQGVGYRVTESCKEAGWPRNAHPNSRCIEQRYSIRENCNGSIGGCLIRITNPQPTRYLNICNNEGSSGVGGGGLEPRPYQQPSGACVSPGGCGYYNRVYNWCSGRWENLNCRWCPSAALVNSRRRFCGTMNNICANESTCTGTGCSRTPDDDDDETFLDKDNKVKCGRQAGERNSDCQPDLLKDNDGDGRPDNGDEVSAVVKKKKGCNPDDYPSNPWACYEISCLDGSRLVFTTEIGIDQSVAHPKCIVEDACQYNASVTGNPGRCGCNDGWIWDGVDRCVLENEGCSGGRVASAGRCVCPSGTYSNPATGECTQVAEGGIPFTPSSACVLDATNTSWAITAFGNTLGTNMIGVFNEVYGPACKILAGRIAYFGASGLKQRIESYGPGTCPAISFGDNFQFGGELLVMGNDGEWHRENERKAYEVVSSNVVCDWLDEQRNDIGTLMIFLFNLSALAYAIGSRRGG